MDGQEHVKTRGKDVSKVMVKEIATDNLEYTRCVTVKQQWEKNNMMTLFYLRADLSLTTRVFCFASSSIFASSLSVKSVP